MAWQHGGLGPMQGQANHFNVSAIIYLKRAVIKTKTEVRQRAHSLRHATLHRRDRETGRNPRLSP